MALLYLLPAVDRRLGLGLRVAALHVDYGARGAESDRDRAIVEQACATPACRSRCVRLRVDSGARDFQARAREIALPARP